MASNLRGYCTTNVYNFLDINIKSQVMSAAVSADGYEVTNLFCGAKTSTSTGHLYYEHGRNGFRVEHFVKPPIDIVVTLPCYVNIDRVSLLPQNGSLKILNFEILTRTAKVKEHNGKDMATGTVSALQPTHYKGETLQWQSRRKRERKNSTIKSKPYERTELMHNTRDGNIYPLKFDIDLKDEPTAQVQDSWNKLTFYNASVPKSRMIHLHRPNLACNELINVFDDHCFQFVYPRYAYNTSHVILRIKRMARSSVIGLGGLEVWGTVSNLNPRFVLEEIANIMSRSYLSARESSVKTNTDSKNSDLKNENQVTELEPETAGDCVPTEFLDAITYETMVLPMLLPSGHSIDKSTLDRCIVENEKLGKIPGDPFTGLSFTATRKPVPNVSLKARMDKYSLNGQSKSRAPNLQSLGTSTFHSSTVQNVIKSSVLETKVNESVKIPRPAVSRFNRQANRDNISDKNDTRETSQMTANAIHKSHGNTISVVNNFNSTSIHSGKFEDHEASLSRSLQSSLSGKLNLVSNIFNRPVMDSDTAEKSCSLCCFQASDEIWYALPCSHFLCRTCALKTMTNSNCTVCKLSYCKNDLKRFHKHEGFFA